MLDRLVKAMLSFVRKCQIVFQSDPAILHISNEQAFLLYQQWVFSVVQLLTINM